MANAALKAAWQLFWHNSNCLLTITFLYIVPLALFESVPEMLFDPEDPQFLVFLLLYILLSVCLNLVYLGALSHGLQSAWNGIHENYGELAGRGFQTFWRMLLAMILSLLFMVPGILLLIIPGIIIALKLIFVPFIIALEDASAMKAITLSWRRTKGMTLSIWGTAILTLLPLMLFFFTMAILIAIFTPSLFGTPVVSYLQSIASGVAMLFLYCVYFAFYQYALQREHEASPPPDVEPPMLEPAEELG